MALSKEEIIINKHIDDMRERMRILQNDRKANSAMHEESKKRNVEELKRLKEENRDFRQKIATLQRMQMEACDQDEQRHLEGEVDNLRRVYNTLKLQTVRLKKQLHQLYDGMQVAELESEKPQLSDNEFTRKIRTLENRLDTSMIKYNEAQGIKKTYEQIVYRLRDERFGFEHQLSLTEKQLNAKQRDYEELLTLSQEAYHAKEVAFHELEAARRSYEENRKLREKELREKHQLVQLRKQMVERNKEREKLRLKLLENENKEKELQLQNAERNKSLFATEKLSLCNKIDIFEEAFRKIKEATGVSNVNEVINKITTQGNSTESLINLSRENHNKIESLHQQYRKLRIHVEDLKYSNSSSGQYRKLLDDEESRLNESKKKLDLSQERFEKLSKLLIVLKSGVGHFNDVLEPLHADMTAVPEEEELSVVLRSDAAAMARKRNFVTDENVTYKLQEFQRMIAHLLILLSNPTGVTSSFSVGANNSLTHQISASNKPFNGMLALEDNSSSNPAQFPVESNSSSTMFTHPLLERHAAPSSAPGSALDQKTASLMGLDTHPSSENLPGNIPISSSSVGNTTSILAIDEEISNYMTRGNFANQNNLYHQSSGLEDLDPPKGVKSAFDNDPFPVIAGTHSRARLSQIENIDSERAGAVTASAMDQVGYGIAFNPSKLRQKQVIDEDEEDDEINKHKRIDVKRASAEILRKMESKQRLDNLKSELLLQQQQEQTKNKTKKK